MRENCSVGCQQEGCSRQGQPEQRRPVTTTFKSPSCTTVSFPAKLERSVREGVYTYIQDDRYGGWVPSKAKANKITKNKNKKTEKKSGYLKKESCL